MHVSSVMNWATGRVGAQCAYSDAGTPGLRADAVSGDGDNPTLHITSSGPYSLYKSDLRQGDSMPTD